MRCNKCLLICISGTVSSAELFPVFSDLFYFLIVSAAAFLIELFAALSPCVPLCLSACVCLLCRGLWTLRGVFSLSGVFWVWPTVVLRLYARVNMEKRLQVIGPALSYLKTYRSTTNVTHEVWCGPKRQPIVSNSSADLVVSGGSATGVSAETSWAPTCCNSHFYTVYTLRKHPQCSARTSTTQEFTRSWWMH